MISKKILWTICGSLLVAAAPTITQAAGRASDTKLVCRWGKPPGSAVKEEYCATAAQWRAFFNRRAQQVREPARWGPNNSAAPPGTSYSTSVPGMTGFGTGSSPSDFQRR